MTIEELLESLKTRPDTIGLDRYYAANESVAKVLEEIKVKVSMVSTGLEEFTECEKLAFAIIVKTLEGSRSDCP